MASTADPQSATAPAPGPVQRSSASPLTVLRNRSFATMWLAGLVSDTGTWMQAITVGVLVARLTGKASTTGLVGVAGFAMQGLGAPIGGVLADRFDRRRLFIAALGAQTAVTAALALALMPTRPSVALMSTLIALQGLAGSFAMPSAQAIMPTLVRRDELGKAMSLGAMSWNGGRIFGSLLAGAGAVLLEPAVVIALNAATFAVLIVAVSLLPGSFHPPARADDAAPPSFFGDLAAGARALLAAPGCRFALGATLFMQAAIVVWAGLIPIYAQEQLRGTRSLASTITMVQGAGALAGAALATWLIMRVGRPRAVVTAAVAAGLSMLGYARAATAPQALPFAFALGMCTVGLYVMLGAVIQRDAPERARARIVAIQSATLGVTYGVSVLSAGALADHIGLGLVHGLLGATFLVGIAVTAVLRKDAWRVLGRGDTMSIRWEHHLQRLASSEVRPEP